MVRTDILLNEDGTPIIENGDFVIGPSDEQHIQDNLLSSPGHYKNAPTLGANLLEYQDSEFDDVIKENMRRNVSLSLQIDGYKLLSWDMTTGDINVGTNQDI
jgi:hypothetical protein